MPFEDGVFARDGAGALSFHPTPHLTTLDVAEVLATMEPLVSRWLDRLGLVVALVCVGWATSLSQLRRSSAYAAMRCVHP